MTYSESLMWAAYIQKRGSLNWGMRGEHGTAILATLKNRSMGGKAEMSDFMPHHEETPLSLEEAMKAFPGIVVQNRDQAAARKAAKRKEKP